MSSLEHAAVSTRGAVFEPLIAVAKARVVAMVDAGSLAAADGEFLLRALIDLECDGIVLFGDAGAADGEFYTAVTDYLAARVGSLARETPVLAPASAEALAAIEASEGPRVSKLLGLPAAAPCGRDLDRAVLQLISHKGGRA